MLRFSRSRSLLLARLAGVLNRPTPRGMDGRDGVVGAEVRVDVVDPAWRMTKSTTQFLSLVTPPLPFSSASGREKQDVFAHQTIHPRISIIEVRGENEAKLLAHHWRRARREKKSNQSIGLRARTHSRALHHPGKNLHNFYQLFRPGYLPAQPHMSSPVKSSSCGLPCCCPPRHAQQRHHLHLHPPTSSTARCWLPRRRDCCLVCALLLAGCWVCATPAATALSAVSFLLLFLSRLLQPSAFDLLAVGYRRACRETDCCPMMLEANRSWKCGL
ncbi:hypothetical protein IWZ01DRAFT_344070 [Phyllosticta capitalensis]